ncbi:MAG: cobalamin synthase, partial [Glaciecola sp.]
TLAVVTLCLGIAAVGVIPASIVAMFVLGSFARRKIGGATGDVLGATVIASMLATMTMAVALTRLGVW